jgi:hypothetical protein
MERLRKKVRWLFVLELVLILAIAMAVAFIIML